MEHLELAKKRYSCRKYQAKAVEQEKLDRILEAGRVAPTAANRQPQKIIVVRQPEGLAKVAKACNPFQAPLVLIICADTSAAWIRKYDQFQTTAVDASIVTDHMMLEAADLGLGSVWICAFDPQVVRSEFELPDQLVPINILAIGYADEEPASPKRHADARKPLAETVAYEYL